MPYRSKNGRIFKLQVHSRPDLEYESNIFRQNGGQKDRIRQIRMRKNRFQQVQEVKTQTISGTTFGDEGKLLLPQKKNGIDYRVLEPWDCQKNSSSSGEYRYEKKQ